MVDNSYRVSSYDRPVNIVLDLMTHNIIMGMRSSIDRARNYREIAKTRVRCPTFLQNSKIAFLTVMSRESEWIAHSDFVDHRNPNGESIRIFENIRNGVHKYPNGSDYCGIENPNGGPHSDIGGQENPKR